MAFIRRPTRQGGHTDPSVPWSARLGTAGREWLGENRLAIALLAGCLFLFTPAIWWGLPHATGPVSARGWDIDAVAGLSTLSELSNLFIQAQPDWYFAYPAFHYLLLGVVYAPYLALLWITGGLTTPSGAYPYGFTNPVEAIRTLSIIGRLVSLSMAIGTVLAAFATARVLWNRRAGVIAALIVMLITPVVYRAKTGNLDVPTLFWTAMGIMVVASATVRGFTVRRAIWLGVFAALSTATKDQAYAIWVGALPLLFIGHLRGTLPPDGKTAGARWAAPLATILVGLSVYAIASGVLFSPHRFVEHARYVLEYREPRLDFPELGLERARSATGIALLIWDLVRGLAVAAGAPFMLSGVVGLILLTRRVVIGRLLAGMLVGWLLLSIIPLQHVQPRYVIAPAYVLALPAAFVLARWWSRGAGARIFAAALLLIGTVVQLVFAADLTFQMLRDSRYPAEAYLDAQPIRNARFAYWGNPGPLLRREEYLEYVAIPTATIEETRRILEQQEIDYVLVTADFTTPPGWKHSLVMPVAVYRALEDGSLGFDRIASFETKPPLGRRYAFVNPPVAIYERRR